MLNMSELARRAGMEPRRLMDFFYSYYGRNPRIEQTKFYPEQQAIHQALRDHATMILRLLGEIPEPLFEDEDVEIPPAVRRGKGRKF